jgi:hypothetical protein
LTRRPVEDAVQFAVPLPYTICAPAFPQGPS